MKDFEHYLYESINTNYSTQFDKNTGNYIITLLHKFEERGKSYKDIIDFIRNKKNIDIKSRGNRMLTKSKTKYDKIIDIINSINL